MRSSGRRTEADVAATQLDRFRRQTGHPDYRIAARLVDSLTGCSSGATLWDFAQIVGERGDAVVEHLDRMPGARWFPHARLNYAENLLRRRDERRR